MDPVYWAIALFGVGLVLAVAEMFLPSGGALGLVSAACCVGSVAMAFYLGSMKTGFSMVIAAGIAVPLLLGLGAKYWPRTALGQRLLLDLPKPEEVAPDDRGMKALVGKLGRAKSVMLPSGPVDIEGHIVDAVSEGMVIEKGEMVKVIEVRANRVVVRPAKNSPPAPPPNRDDVLSRGIDELGLEDPLA